MHYKTIVLELLNQHPEIHEELRRSRTLLQTVEAYAGEVKIRHETWKDRLSKVKPGSDPSQITSEALEIVLKELEDFLVSFSLSEADGPLSLDRAMAFVRARTTPT